MDKLKTKIPEDLKKELETIKDPKLLNTFIGVLNKDSDVKKELYETPGILKGEKKASELGLTEGEVQKLLAALNGLVGEMESAVHEADSKGYKNKIRAIKKYLHKREDGYVGIITYLEKAGY